MSEKDGSVSEREDVSFERFRTEHAASFFFDGVNGVMVGKRLEAIRSPSARRSFMVSALSRIFSERGRLLFFGMAGACGLGS